MLAYPAVVSTAQFAWRRCEPQREANCRHAKCNGPYGDGPYHKHLEAAASTTYVFLPVRSHPSVRPEGDIGTLNRLRECAVPSGVRDHRTADEALRRGWTVRWSGGQLRRGKSASRRID